MKPRRQRLPKVLLVKLPAPPPGAIGSTGNACLSAGCLAVAAATDGVADKFDVKVVPPQVADSFGDAALADHIAAAEPAVLGFSLYMWNAERSLHIAREVKRRLPQTMIVVGGPEVQPDNVFLLRQKGFDVAVTGEGEEVFGGILESVARGKSLDGLASIAVRGKKGMGAFTPGGSARHALNRYQSPYLAGAIPIDKDSSIYVETARGCSAGCSYCFYSRGHAAVRRLGVEDMKSLLGRLALSGATNFTILDPSFNLRPDFGELLAAIATLNRKRRLSFFGEIRAEALTDRQMDLLVKAGFTKLEIGLQSVNPRTLRRIGRGGKPDEVVGAARKLKERGIELLVDLMVGLPGDSRKDALAGVEALCDAGMGECAQVLPLSVLPGTALRESAKRDGILFDEAPPYRVVRTATMTEEDLAESILQAEEMLGRRVDEYPRPFLVSPGHADGTSGLRDIFLIDVDDSEADALRIASASGARHAALWLDGADLFVRRDVIRRAIEARMATDPYCALDVVLVARSPFPIDLADLARKTLASGPEWYLTRYLAARGENAARRVCVVIPRDASLPDDYVEALAAELPVFKDMTLDEALEFPERLGDGVPSARIVGKNPQAGEGRLLELARRADPEAVVFASRELETWWARKALA